MEAGIVPANGEPVMGVDSTGKAQFVRTDASGNLGVSPTPSGATVITASSGSVAASPAVATLAGVAGKTTSISGFQITSTGSTGAATVVATVTGLAGGTISYIYATVAGATLPNTPLTVSFTPPLPASAVNTAIVVTLPSLGSGNLAAIVNAQGYQV
jgi:hypothetical protein